MNSKIKNHLNIFTLVLSANRLVYQLNQSCASKPINLFSLLLWDSECMKYNLTAAYYLKERQDILLAKLKYHLFFRNKYCLNNFFYLEYILIEKIYFCVKKSYGWDSRDGNVINILQYDFYALPLCFPCSG